MCCCWLVLLLVVNVELLPVNETSYPKVSKWGNFEANEGRSSGQSLYTQRSEARISSGQNVPKGRIHYVLPSNSRVGVDKSNKLPGKGEVVIQDRFNPPPYLEYAHGNNKPDNSFRPSKPEKQPTSLYDSPISSYIPQPSGIPKNKPDITGPSFPAPVYMDDANKPDAKPGYSYEPPKAPPPAMMMDGGSYEGPYAPPADDDAKPDYMDYPPSNPTSYADGDPYDDHKHHHHHESEEQPDEHKHHHHHESEEQPDEHKHHHHDDIPPLSPPPSGVASDFSKHVPEFLDHDPTGSFPYDVPYHLSDQEYGHQVYKEIPHTTEMPEDTRVNKGHYSYYYLGRKLWYIPLYFSVYFIIYITVLILKSIARHKVNFSYNLRDSVKARSLDGVENLEETTGAVTTAISTFKRRYFAM